jgi:hypothetical protein
MRFEKGRSGNPGGRPKGDGEIRELARQQVVAGREGRGGYRSGSDRLVATLSADSDRSGGDQVSLSLGDL